MFDVSEYFNNKGVLNWRQVGSLNLIFTTFLKRVFVAAMAQQCSPHHPSWAAHLWLIYVDMGLYGLYIYMLIYVGYIIMVDICWYTIPHHHLWIIYWLDYVRKNPTSTVDQMPNFRQGFTCQVAWGDAPEAAEAPPLGNFGRVGRPRGWPSSTKIRHIRHTFPPNVCPAAKDLRSSSNRKFQGLLVVGGEWLPSILFSH